MVYQVHAGRGGQVCGCGIVIMMGEEAVVGVDVGNSGLRVYFGGKAISMYNSLLLEKGNAFINKRPTNQCLVDIPLLAGFKFDDSAFQELSKHYNYTFRKGNNRSILAKLPHEAAIEEFHPELALLLMLRGVFVTNPHLKYLIEHKPLKLVVTVFEGDNNSYRLALAHSLTAIGATSYTLVSSGACIAAAYLRDLRQDRDEREVVGVVDFGDRGVSVTVAKVFSQEVGVVEVLRSEFSHLGGNHLTNLLAAHVARQLAREKGMDVTRTPAIMHRLKLLCDEAKRTLSQSQMAFVRLDGLPDISIYGCEVSATQFEECTRAALQANIELIKSSLTDFQISKLILAGNSCKIPSFRAMVSQQLKQYRALGSSEEWLREGMLLVRGGKVQVLEVTAFELRIEGDEKFSCVAIRKGESVPLRRKLEMRFPSGELTYSMRFFQNGLLVAAALIPERPSETKYNLYLEVDRNKMLNIYATNTRGLIKMTCNFMDLPKDEYRRYSELLTQIDFHNEND